MFMKDGYVDAEKHEFSIDLFPFEMTNLRIPVYVKPLEYTIEEYELPPPKGRGFLVQ